MDWIAEAKRIGEWDWVSLEDEPYGLFFCEGFDEMLVQAATEQLAARDAVLRVHKLCKRAMPEVPADGETIRALRAERDAAVEREQHANLRIESFLDVEAALRARVADLEAEVEALWVVLEETEVKLAAATSPASSTVRKPRS